MLVAPHTIVINGKSGSLSLAGDWIRALNNPQILKEKAGFLFKVLAEDDRLMVAVVPALIHGERTYHYALRLEQESAFTLIGDVNAQGVFTILFKPESCEAAMKHQRDYIEQFRRFASFLSLAGYNGAGLLDEVTQGLLQELGLSPVPDRLSGL
jgi:hypothetical protein